MEREYCGKKYQLTHTGRYSCHQCTFYSSKPVGCYIPNDFGDKMCNHYEYIDYTWQKREEMTDITKCKPESCDIKHLCRRFTEPASEYQSYFAPTERPCPMFWGKESDAIMQMLERIVKGEEKFG